ncbi:unnamed protein product, partial [Allacma fusca]
ADLKRENCQLVRSGRVSENSKFPTGVDYPVGLALIYNEKPKVLENVKLNKQGDHYIRTEVDSQKRCSSLEISERTMPFQLNLFKSTTPSSGDPNHCNDALDFSIDTLLPYRNVSNDVNLGELTLPCKSFVEDPENSFGVITSDLNYRNWLALSLSENVNENIFSILGGDNQTGCHDLVETVNVNTNAEYTESNDICQNDDTCGQHKYKINVIDQKDFERNLEMEKGNVWHGNGCDRLPKMVVDAIASL